MRKGQQAIWDYDDHAGRALVEVCSAGKQMPWARIYRVRVVEVMTPSAIRRVKVGSTYEVTEVQLADAN